MIAWRIAFTRPGDVDRDDDELAGRGPVTSHQGSLYYEDMPSDTWYMVSLTRDQWVKAVGFDWNGQVYHTDFDLGPAGYNY